ncbi:MAG: hypothetical protein OEY89_14525 [Gammaproteobacteria bacterium]|nr:hypothetical protein [Gammaproteobacteria bacterium]
MKKLLIATAIAISLNACSSAPTMTAVDAQAAIAAAEYETQRASELKYEWRDSGDLIKEAKSAEQKQDFALAVKLADQAKRQSSNAIKQYHDQKNAGPAF